MTRGPKPVLAKHVACLLQRDPTANALRELEQRATGDMETTWAIINEFDQLATRSSRWSQRLRRALAPQWGPAMTDDWDETALFIVAALVAVFVLSWAIDKWRRRRR